MKIKMFRSIVPPLTMSLALLIASTHIAMARSLFFDNFAQFTNGADLTSTNYVPASGPASASVITRIDNGLPTIVATNFLGNTWAFLDNSAVPNKDDYRGYLSTLQTNQPLEITWKMWIQATNSGNGAFLLSVPVHDPANPGITYNPPLAFLDTGAIIGLTNGTSMRIPIGNWGSLAGTVMTNTLILDYSEGTFSYSLSGQTLATLPLGPYFTNVVDSITFTAIERDLGSLGNRFAISDVKVDVVPSAQKSPFQWARRIASNSSWPEGEPNIGLALDTYDNCYVTGFFDGTNDFGGVTLTNQSVSGSDMFVAKYNSTGTLQWVQQAGGTAVNYGRGIGVDTNGNVYVAGGYQGPANFGSTNLPATSGEEFFLAKYDNVGTLQWVQTSTGGSDDVYGIGLAVDGAGNFYALVTVDHLSNQATNITFGSTTVSIPANNGSPVMVLVKYDNTGVVKWVQLIDSSDETYAPEVAVDAAGNAYVHGIFVSDLTIGSSNLVGNAGIENLFVAKFEGAGNLAWVLTPQSQGGIAIADGGVAVDPAGNVFVSGAFDGRLNFGSGIVVTNSGTNIEFDGTSFDGFVAKYNSSGLIQWAHQAGGTNDGFYWDVALEMQTNVDAAGYLNSKAAVAEYDGDGTLQWASSASGCFVIKCAVDSADNCYMVGFYPGTATFGTNVL